MNYIWILYKNQAYIYRSQESHHDMYFMARNLLKAKDHEITQWCQIWFDPNGIAATSLKHD